MLFRSKEFELRRNASQMARASVSKTGELDIDKVFSYKFKEDLFKRITKIPNGKNHGMVLFVDWSGSMSSVLKSTIDQALILADFCRKVNIPFRVFAFSDDPTAATIIPRGNSKNIMKFSRKEGELNFGSTSFNALELLSRDRKSTRLNSSH